MRTSIRRLLQTAEMAALKPLDRRQITLSRHPRPPSHKLGAAEPVDQTFLKASYGCWPGGFEFLAISQRRSGELLMFSRKSSVMLITVQALLCASLAAAQTQTTSMWGVGGSDGNSSLPDTLRSTEMHAGAGIVAGQVSAARDGILYQGSSVTMNTIGAQNIIQVSIDGHNNALEIDADQDSSNSGKVTNDGTIIVTP